MTAAFLRPDDRISGRENRISDQENRILNRSNRIIGQLHTLIHLIMVFLITGRCGFACEYLHWGFRNL